jgi:glycosyltransferase involved in cell wall biosynthesis
VSVSIVINNYNYAQYLGEAISSALEQEEPALEVIVVDDGSTDSSHEVIESFGSRIQAIFQRNGGQAAAFNTGIRAAKGDWIWLLDADDSLKPDAVRKASTLTAPGIARIAMGMEQIDAEGTPIGTKAPNGGRAFEGSLRDVLLLQGGLPSIPTSGNLFSREALLAILPVPESSFRICADAYLFVMTGKFGRMKLDTSIVANYRIHGENNFFRHNTNAPDPKALTKELDNVLLTLALFDDYGQTISPTDRKKIRSYWLGDQVLLMVLRAKLARLPHPALAAWPWSRLLFGFLSILMTSPQSFKIRQQKCRKALKLALKLG